MDPITERTFQSIKSKAQEGLEGNRDDMTRALASIQMEARAALAIGGPFSYDEDRTLRLVAAKEVPELAPLDPAIGADELNGWLERALQYNLVEVPVDSAVTLGVYPYSEAEPKPILVINPGRGPKVMRSEPLDIRPPEYDEVGDAVVFTARVLEEIVGEANQLARESRW
jgi:hypothetical protein